MLLQAKGKPISCKKLDFAADSATDPVRSAALMTVNGIKILVMLDSGAETSVISDSAYRHLYPHRTPILQKDNTTYTSILGGNLHSLGKTQIRFDECQPIDVTVFPDFAHHMILGIDGLKKGNYICNSEHLIWFGRKYPLYPYKNKYITKYIGLLEVSPSQQTRLNKILSTYDKLFSEKDMPDLLITDVKLDIDTGDHPPIKMAPYRVPLARQHIIKDQVQQMLDAGIIKRGYSPWAAPVHLVPKKDGNMRMVVNFTRLNSISTTDAYPVPNIQDIFDSLTKSAVYTSLDALKGYYQIQLSEAAKQKAAFVCPTGQYLFERLPMGLKNSGATFCRVIESILRDFIGTFVHVYVDDIIIYSKNMDEHLKHLDIVFNRLSQHNVQLRKSKCKIAKESVELLGFNISASGVSTDPSKLDPILKAPAPKSKQQVQSFLGSVNYYRKFIPLYSELAIPLYDLTKKNTPFKWTDLHNEAFIQLKAYLADTPILAYPDVAKPYKLFTDASSKAMGAVLLQTDDKGCDRVIQYFSRRFNGPQTRYSTIERECLALISAMEHFKPYLLGSYVTIHTDHRPLLALKKKRLYNDRINRWAIILSDYDFDIVYTKGSCNNMADWLSRSAVGLDTLDMGDFIVPEVDSQVLAHIPIEHDHITYIDIINEQRKDFPQLYDSDDEHIVCHAGVLYSTRRPTRLDLLYPRLLLPSKFRHQVMHNAHIACAHSGIKKTLDQIRQCYIWSGMRKDVINFIELCGTCQLNRRINVKRKHYTIDYTNVKNHTIGLDLMGPLMTTSTGNRYILVMVDHATRYCVAVPLPNKTAKVVRDAFYRYWICSHSIPDKIITDGGLEFRNQLMKDLCKSLGIKHAFTSPYNPSSNGVTERLNSTIKNMLRKLCDNDSSKWEDVLHSCVFAYHCSLHSATLQSPFYLTYGTLARLPHLQPIDRSIQEQNWLKSLTASFQLAKENTEKMVEKNKQRMNAIANEQEFHIGDLVMKKNMTRVKLQSQNKGIFQVIDVRTPVLYLRNLENGKLQITRNNYVLKIDPTMVLKNVNIDPVRLPVDARHVNRFVDLQYLAPAKQPISGQNTSDASVMPLANYGSQEPISAASSKQPTNVHMTSSTQEMPSIEPMNAGTHEEPIDISLSEQPPSGQISSGSHDLIPAEPISMGMYQEPISNEDENLNTADDIIGNDDTPGNTDIRQDHETLASLHKHGSSHEDSFGAHQDIVQDQLNAKNCHSRNTNSTGVTGGNKQSARQINTRYNLRRKIAKPSWHKDYFLQ